MKKMLAIVAAMLLVVPVLAMAGMTAFDNMTELGPEMAEITGQVGITIDQSIDLTIGYLAWTDADGFGTTRCQAQGAVTLSTITISDGASNAMDITGLKIDAGTCTNGTSYLAIGMPTITGQVTIDAIRLGTAGGLGAAGTDSLGAVTVNGIDMAGSTVKIYAH